MFGRKGQGAMEYLMTYGWAILVVMIVGIVMWQLGIFNLGGPSVTSTGFAKIKPQLALAKMTAAGAFTGGFTNGAGSTITVTTWTANETRSTGACTTTAPAANTLVSTGDNFAVGATGCGTGTSGDPYTLVARFTYTQSVGGITVTHTDTGSIRGPFE